MKWPWRRTTETAAPVDVEALARRVAELAAVAGGTPASGAPAAGAPYPLYAYDDPLRYATPMSPSRRPASQVDVRTLRRLADSYDVLRSCIQHLKRELAAVPVEFVPRDHKDDSPATKAAIEEMRAFLSTRGGLGGAGTERDEFEAELVEDISVIGAGAVYYHPTRGGWPYEVVTVDAATIRPKVDAFGWPGPGEAVFEQWVQGIKVAEFTREQMDYRGLPICKRSYSPYYWSPVEWLVHVVESALRADQWNRAWLTDGNSATETYALPEGWTPEQVKTWSAFWDAMLSGTTSERVKTKFLPGGSQRVGTNTRKDQDFQEFELWLLRRTCAIMGVQPASIGYSGEQYKVSQEGSMESGSFFGTAPLLSRRKSFYDDLCERMGYPQIESRNVTTREEKSGERADREQKECGVPTKTINQVRQARGEDPIEGGNVLWIPSTYRPLQEAVGGSREAGVESREAGLESREAARGGQQSGGDAVDGHYGFRSDRADLLRWQRKAINALRRDGSPGCSFESDDIPPSVRLFVEEQLDDCTHAGDVRALFRQAAEMG